MSAPPFQRWICDACGFIYDEAVGDPDSGLDPGTRYADIPDDWQCPLCGLNKTDLRLIPDATAKVVKRPNTPRISAVKCRGSDEHIVVVGAGIAGWAVVEAIRAHDSETPILLVSACEGVSYPKPALSTALAHGKTADDLSESDAASKAASLGIDVRTETRVLKIDSDKRRITTSKGGIQYRKLVLALGAHQRELAVAGNAADQVVRVNDLAAYRRMRGLLEDGAQHVTILGAGLIGCEFAEGLTAGGYAVDVVDPTNYPLSNLIPGDVAERLRDTLSESGVAWHFQATLDCLELSGNRLRATLSSGVAIETDLVLSAAGLVPNTALAEKAGLAVGKGIIADLDLRTSHSDIYAVGDCVEVEGRLFAYIEPIRRQAQSIAANLRGESIPFDVNPPLVRVKTPSFPLTICPPGPLSGAGKVASSTRDSGRIDYLDGERLLGFVLAGEQAKTSATSLYRQVIGS